MLQVVDVLLRAGANASAETNCGDIALHIACYEKHHACIAHLAAVSPGQWRVQFVVHVIYAISVDSRDHELRTALHYSTQRGDVHAVQLLTGDLYRADVAALDAYQGVSTVACAMP